MLAVAQRNGHHPGMALHAALVAFGYGKSQRVVAGVAAYLSGQYGVVGLDGRFVEDISPCTGLEQYGVEVGGFQSVQYFNQFGLLLADAFGRSGACLRPVQPIDGGYPGGTYFMFGRLCGKRQQDGYI